MFILLQIVTFTSQDTSLHGVRVWSAYLPINVAAKLEQKSTGSKSQFQKY